MENSTASDQSFHILDQMRQWVKSSTDPSYENEIVQFKKGTQLEFTYSTKNGRFLKFMARIINFFSKKDYFDKKNIGNSKRQKKVADMFRYQIKNARNDPNYVFECPTNKLTRKYVEGELRTAGLLENNFLPQMVPQNDNLGVFGNSTFDKDFCACFDFQTDLQTLAGINVDGLSNSQSKALEKVYLNWQSSIEGAASIPENNRGHILGNLIRNSTLLLQNIKHDQQVADQYLGHCREMADKLSKFLTKNVQDNATFEQTSQDAFDLMSEFTQFARDYGNILQLGKANPSFGDSILFPVLQVATKLGVDESFQGHLAGNKANVVNSLLQSADKLTALRKKNYIIFRHHIKSENYRDISYKLAISLEPIRCFFNLVGGGGTANVMEQPQDINDPHAIKANDLDACFVIKANEFVNQYSFQKINWQWHAKQRLIDDKIDDDKHLQNSFNSFIGIPWKNLTPEQKENIIDILYTFTDIAIITDKDVESYLKEMKPILLKVMDDVSFIKQFQNTMKTVAESMINLCKNEASGNLEINYAITMYMNGIAKPLIELNKQLGAKMNLGSLSMYAVCMAKNKCYEENFDACIEFGSSVAKETSICQRLAKTTQAMQLEQSGMLVEKKIDKFAKKEVLNMEPLCQFALYMNKAVKSSDQFKGTVMTGKESWLKPGKMSEEDYDKFLENESVIRDFIINRNIISNQINEICNDDSVAAEFPNQNDIDQIPEAWEQAFQNHFIFITDRRCNDIINILGKRTETINLEQKRAVKQFSYLFIDEHNAVAEEAVKENSLFLNALLEDPKFSESLQQYIDQLAENIDQLAVLGQSRFVKIGIMSSCAGLLNKIKIFCENKLFESKISDEFMKINFGMIISGIASVLAKNQPNFYKKLANNIDNSLQAQYLLAAFANLQFNEEQDHITKDEGITNYASASIFLPLISKAYMSRDGDKNGLGVKILNSISKDEICAHLKSGLPTKYDTIQQILYSRMKDQYDVTEKLKTIHVEHRQRIKAEAKEREDTNKLATAVNWESFRLVLNDALARSDDKEGGKPPFDPLMMFKILVLKEKNNISNAQIAKEIKINEHFHEFLGITFDDPYPDVDTIRKFQNDLEQADAYQKLFIQLEPQLSAAGLSAIKGQSMEAT